MEIAVIIGIGYLAIYLLWLLMLIVVNKPEKWWSVTMFFILMPIMVLFSTGAFVFVLLFTPILVFFSKKARMEIRKIMEEQGI